MVLSNAQWLANPGSAAFEIGNSCRFNDNDSAYLNRTPAGDGDRTEWIFSTWVKRGNLDSGTHFMILSSYPEDYLTFSTTANDTLKWYNIDGNDEAVTTAIYRDPHAWGNLICSFHSDFTTTANRIEIYWNNVLVATGATATGQQTTMNSAASTSIGRFDQSNNAFFDGYLAETVFIDGNSIQRDFSTTDFGETDDNGVWRPIDVSGLTFGTNGFYLNYADSSDLGNDVSGNNNDFTSSGLADVDQMIDTPTNNLCTLDPLSKGTLTLSNGNTQYVCGTSWHSVMCTIGMTSGKWYWECNVGTSLSNSEHGIVKNPQLIDWVGGAAIDANGWVMDTANRKTYNHSTSADTDYTGAYSNNDVIGVAVDFDNGKMWFRDNADWLGGGDPAAGTSAAFTDIPTDGTMCVPANSLDSSTAFQTVNFGTTTLGSGGNADGNGFGDFDYSVPSGFLALCTTNLAAPAIPDPTAQFQPNTRTGDGSAGAVAQTGNSQFGTDLIIIKNRDQTDEWKVVDTGRGATKEINTDSTNAESTDSNGVTAFSATDGYTIGTGAGGYNDDTEDFIDYHFQEGSTPGMGINASVSHTQGSETEIAHGMGLVPAFAMVKETDAATAWWIFHKNLTSKTGNYLAFSTAGEASITDVWGTQSSTNFVIGGAAGGLASGTYVCYSFAEVAGFSSFGKYEGNGLDNGTFVNVGFKPALLICKAIDRGVTGWFTYDSKRDGYNGVPGNNPLFLNTTAAETVLSAPSVDLLSNGWKFREAGGPNHSTGGTFVYMAWAENPFGGHGGTFGGGVSPATAR